SVDAALTGKLAVCAGSCGQGHLHLINCLSDAQRSRVPVLAIATHIPHDELGADFFQEPHPTDVFRVCSVSVEHVAQPQQTPRLLRIAMREAIEKRGFADLVTPGYIGLSEIDVAAEVVKS